MTTMYVIRHGQARFGSRNYDRLSPLGEKQASLLGRHFAGQGLRFDAVYSGPLIRQVETARLVAEAMGSRCETVINPAFAELDVEAILAGSGVPPERAYESPDAYREFMDAAVMQSLDDPERLPREKRVDTFIEGVHNGIAQLAAAHADRDCVAVFTSGGPIAAFMQSAMDLSTREAIRLPWKIMNTSFSIVHLDGGRMDLRVFNSTAHLEDAGRPDWKTLL